MASKCGVCHEKDAETRCIECHKWVCDSCSFKDHNGVFCSRECANKYRDFQKTQVSDTEGAGRSLMGELVRKAFALIVLLLLVFAVYVYGARKGWFGSEEKSRVENGMEVLKEEIDKGAEKAKELNEEAEERIGQSDGD